MSYDYSQLSAESVAKEALEVFRPADSQLCLEYDVTLPTDRREFMLWRGLSPEDAVQIVLCRHDPSLPHPGSRRSPACHRPDALQLLCGLVSGLEDLMSRRDAFANERNQHRASHMSELRTEWAAQSRDARFLPASQLV